MKLVGDYQISNKISEGASGVVYFAERAGVKYALKHLKSADAAALVRFRRESSTLARFSSKHLVRIFDVGEFEGAPFMVMELLLGDSLEKVLAQNHGGLAEQDCLDMARSMAAGLAELHKNGLVHRDVKPANIFLTKDKSFKLIDFGLIGDIREIRNENALVGTPLYCSPEQSRVLKRDVDVRSDLYSLGVTLFEIVTGRVPFIGSLTEILQQHSSRPAPLANTLKATIKLSLTKIIAKLLAKDPDDRYQTAISLLHDLNNIDSLEQELIENKEIALGTKFKTNYASTVAYVRRETEEKKLKAAWASVNGGKPGIAIVTGAAGLGKSRLCDEFIRTLTGDHVLTFKSKCQFFDRGLPFGSILEPLEILLENLHLADKREKQDLFTKIISAAVGHEASLVRFSKGLSRLLNSQSKTDLPQQDAESAQDSYFRSIAQFFSNLCDQWGTLVFQIDDAQWMDDSSLKVMELMFSILSEKKFFVVASLRNDEKSKEQADSFALRFENVTLDKISVEPFAPNQIYTLVNEFLGGRDVARTIVDQIKNRSQGNPFIAIDIIRACLDQGCLSFRNNAWELDETGLDGLTLSDDVYTAMLKRFDAAPTNVKDFLRHAVMLGNTFLADSVAEIVDFNNDETTEALVNAESLGLIQNAGATKYRFLHDRITEAIFQAMTPESRSSKAASVATYFLNQRKKNPRKEGSDPEILTIARLTQLCAEALPDENVFDANFDAGVYALKNYAYREAYGFLKFAEKNCQRVAEERALWATLCSKLAGCASILGKWEDASALSNLALNEAKTKAEFANFLRQRVWLARREGDSPLAWEYFKIAHTLTIGRYPLYLLGKCVYALSAYFTVLVLDLFSANKKSFSFKSRPPSSFETVELYYNTFYALRNLLWPLDSFIVSLKLLRFGLIYRDGPATALGYAFVAYCCGRIAVLKPMATLFAGKAVALAQESNDYYLLAQCKSISEITWTYTGEVREFDQAMPRETDFYSKYLDPSSRSLLYEHWQGQLLFYGISSKVLPLLRQFTAETTAKGISPPKNEILSREIQTWTALELSGKYSGAQKARTTALATANHFRWVASHSHKALRTEMEIRRFTGEQDEFFNEVVESRFSINFRTMDQFTVYGSLTWTYLLLQKLRKRMEAGSEQEVRRLKTEFIKAWLAEDRRVGAPGLVAMHYHQLGHYFMLTRKDRRALYYFDKAETLANLCASRLSLFEIHLDKSRIFLRNQAKRQFRSNLIQAYDLAREQDWPTKIDGMKEEFGMDFESAVASFETGLRQGVSTHHRGTVESATTAMAQTRTSASTVNTIQNTRHTIAGTVAASTDLDEIRFVDALLNVSSAFVNTLDTREQSKLVLTEIVKLFAAQRGFVFLKPSPEASLEIIAGKDADGGDLSQLIGFSNTVVAKVLDTAKPLIVTGTDEGEALGSESAVLNNLRSIMATPLTVKGTVIGVVYVDSSLTKGLFTEKDIELFATLANHISVAFELSRMAKVELEKATLQRELDVQSVIAQESKKVTTLVDNMQQALFAVDRGGLIVEPVSKYSETVLGKRIVGTNVVDVLYKDLDSEKKDGVRSALTAVFGEDELQWDLMSDNFLRKVKNELPSSKNSTLKIATSPIWNNAELLEKVLFVVEDVTQLETLESQVQEQREKAEILENILESDSSSVGEFLERSYRLIGELRHRAPKMAFTDLVVFLRDLHTLKGNARLSKLAKISSQIHESESLFVEIKKDEKTDINLLIQLMTDELKKISSVCDKYNEVYLRIKASGGNNTVAEGNPHAIMRVEAVLEELRGRIDETNFNRLKLAVRKLNYRPLSSIATKYGAMARDLGAQLKKKVDFRLQGECSINPRHITVLEDCFLHIIRNSLDHGLEESSERIKVNKPESGTITVDCNEGKDSTLLTIKDDGRGIDAKRVLNKALEKNILSKSEAATISDEQVVNLIFAPNFSTKDQATDISGRGLGLDIVKGELEKIGGYVRVSSEPGHGTTFSISLPNEIESPLRAAV